MQSTHARTDALNIARPVSELVPKASLWETLAVMGDVFLPTIAKGVIIRRPAILALAERFDLDRRAIRRMQRLRNKYGTGPLMIDLFGRRLVLLFDPAHVHRVLAETPAPFATSTLEKRAALAHFEPKNVLLSQGQDRVERRRFHEQVLDTDRAVHRLVERFVQVVADETRRMRQEFRRGGVLTWDIFSSAWSRIVRRVVFGDAASEDHEISAAMARLRSAGNWAFLRPQRVDLREQLFDRIRRYLARAERGSLMQRAAEIYIPGQVAPEQQIPQWLFAFDGAAMATFRSLALLGSHPEAARRARDEAASHNSKGTDSLPFLRSTVLESIRLWPTSPLILRETLADTTWESGVVPAHSGIVIYAPFFHRDDESLPYANRFSPELWADEDSVHQWPLIPFSEGPAVCPGRHLVVLISTAVLAGLLEEGGIRLLPPARITSGRPLPATANHFRLRFSLEPGA